MEPPTTHTNQNALKRHQKKIELKLKRWTEKTDLSRSTGREDLCGEAWTPGGGYWK